MVSAIQEHLGLMGVWVSYSYHGILKVLVRVEQIVKVLSVVLVSWWVLVSRLFCPSWD